MSRNVTNTLRPLMLLLIGCGWVVRFLVSRRKMCRKVVLFVLSRGKRSRMMWYPRRKLRSPLFLVVVTVHFLLLMTMLRLSQNVTLMVLTLGRKTRSL